MNVKTMSEIGGWIGMILIHGATVPTTMSVVLGYSSELPPLSMVLLVWSGLFLFLLRAVVAKDTLYIVSNTIGFFFNTILLTLIVY